MSKSNIYKLFDPKSDDNSPLNELIKPESQQNNGSGDSLSSLESLTMAANAVIEQSKQESNEMK